MSLSTRVLLSCACFLAPTMPASAMFGGALQATPSPRAVSEGVSSSTEPAFVWNARNAEHLWNRAGFGASPEEIERAVALGHSAFVAVLLAGGEPREDKFYSRLRDQAGMRRELRDMPPEERREMVGEIRRDDREQGREYLAWWMERMVASEDPLRERMTLFWHGHFTSSMSDVRNSHEMIVQNQFLRAHAFDPFSELVRGIARDPAMLEYLDNKVNHKDSPNENFARELMELFTLGEGNYSEEDVKEAARAFTGWTARDGEFRFARGRHDLGEKTVLGTTGLLDGDDVIEILLRQDACARRLAGKLLSYFEGVESDADRLGEYADILRESDLDVRVFLERLFLDPAFYRGSIVGARIAGPVDFLVGSVRRLGVSPPPELLLAGSALLGQRLFAPPSVKGWEGGEAWITTGSLLQRSNLAGVLLGEVSLREIFRDESMEESRSMEDEMKDAASGELKDDDEERVRQEFGEFKSLRKLRRLRWKPRLRLTAMVHESMGNAGGAGGDLEIIAALGDRVLGRPLESDTRVALAAELRTARADAGIEEGKLLIASLRTEAVLRKITHLILSLPEAQLN